MRPGDYCPPELDWVEARSECTPEKEFDRLSETVQRDLERHNALNPGMAQSLIYGNCPDGTFYVKRDKVHMVTFALSRGRIKIDRTNYAGEGKTLMTISVSLDQTGQCLLTDKDGRQWRSWQVRRKVLEETFFGRATQ